MRQLNTQKDHEKLADIMEPGSVFRWLFDAVDACGDEVEAAGLMGDRELHLLYLAPPEGFRGKRMEVYRAHVRELCGRWKRTRKVADLDHPTSAEVLLGLMETSLVAPLTQTGIALYSRIFAEIFGEDTVPELLKYAEREAWEGQVDEELARLKRRTTPRPRPEDT